VLSTLPPALRHRDFRLFWGGALLVVLGVALIPSARRFSLDDEAKAVVTRWPPAPDTIGPPVPHHDVYGKSVTLAVARCAFFSLEVPSATS
jgi:hypothetical protein